MWEILETTHEGTKAVRLSKLQILTSRFKNLRMKEEESISEFNSRLCDTANKAFALGEKYSEEKLVRKLLDLFLRDLRIRLLPSKKLRT